MRKSGILLPITSLSSEYGIGCFSDSAYRFVDFLKNAGQTYWQILPLGPTSFGDSPYQSFSTFAGNPYMISLKALIDDGVLQKAECDLINFGDTESYIDYQKQFENRFKLLNKAYKRSNLLNDDFCDFCKENDFWLFDYSLFMALKYSFNQKPWNEWPYDIRTRKADALKHYSDKLENEINFWKFIQFTFYKQWKSLKEYANKNNVSIIGDIPIYVSYDSADVWSNPGLFQLDECGLPIEVAGCPPDGFSKNGQLWGNPLYDWEAHFDTDFSWWIKRIKHSFSIYDVLRIDHFRGFDEYYSIKFGSENAICGEWKKGPGFELFKKVEEKLGKKDIIAEDLGFITDSVKDLLLQCGFSGMKVLEFAFDSRDTSSSNDHLPHNYQNNSVCYTATHDNQTLVSWFNTISEEEQKCVRKYLCDFKTEDSKLHIPLIALIMRSASRLSIIPIQDWLGLSDDARINVPSTVGTNWRWRLKKNQLNDDLSKKIYDMTKMYGRL